MSNEHIRLEFWVATAFDKDGGLHWSDVFWGDGYSVEGVLLEVRGMAECAGAPSYCRIEVNGPYMTNGVASCPI